MPDYVTSREFERFAKRIDSKIDGMTTAQQEFFTKQSVINADVSNIKRKYTIITTAVITLMIGTVYGKITEQPAIKPQEEIKIKTVKVKEKE